MMIRDDIAKSAVRVASGEKSEFITVKINCYSPPLVITQCYGATPRQGYGFSEISEEVYEVFSVIRKYQEQGAMSLVSGDINAWLGAEIPGNHFSVNKEGLLWLEMVANREMEFMNKRLQDPVTYVDKRTGRGRALDVIITDFPDNIKEFVIDNDEGRFTPYTPYLKKDGSERRVYSDHRPIFCTMDVKLKEKRSRLGNNKKVVWRKKAKFGKEKFDILTDAMAGELMDAVKDKVSVNAVAGKFLKAIDDAKTKSYGKVTLTKAKEKRIEDKEIWQKRIDEINKLYKEVEKQEPMKQMWFMRKNIKKGERDSQIVSVMREDNGLMMEDKDSIFEYLLEYNSANMAKEEVSEEIEDLVEEKRKWSRLILQHRHEIPRTISWEDFMATVRKVFRQNKGVFQDFINSGSEYKVAVYMLLNRIYIEEIIPEEMRKTVLTKIFKRKGAHRESRTTDSFMVNLGWGNCWKKWW